MSGGQIVNTMNSKLLLSPVAVNWSNSSAELRISIRERQSLIVGFQADLLTEKSVKEILDDNFLEGIETEIRELEIAFPVFAEVRFKMLNFWEFKYGEFEIISEHFDAEKLRNRQDVFRFWAKNEIHPNPGFYLVVNSNWLEELSYGNISRLNLQHYLITGYDSYVEILSQSNFQFNSQSVNEQSSF